MDKLSFYFADHTYVNYLKNAEQCQRGFSRVPDMAYGAHRKPKFLCGIVLKMNKTDYYVPVSSYKQQQADNLLIVVGNGLTTGSLRFNYMFPIPSNLVTERRISAEPDRAYRSLLAQQLQFCNKNRTQIQRLAERTYNRVLKGKNPGLVHNSCDFRLLEEKCREYNPNP